MEAIGDTTRTLATASPLRSGKAVTTTPQLIVVKKPTVIFGSGGWLLQIIPQIWRFSNPVAGFPGLLEGTDAPRENLVVNRHCSV